LARRAAWRSGRGDGGGVQGLPAFFLDGYSLFSGAMPVKSIAGALRRGRAMLRQRQSG